MPLLFKPFLKEVLKEMAIVLAQVAVVSILLITKVHKMNKLKAGLTILVLEFVCVFIALVIEDMLKAG
jgi:hypothetical protein